MHSLVLEVDPESPRTVFFAVKLFLVAVTVAPTCPHLSCSFSFLMPTFAVPVGEKRLSMTWSRQTIQALTASLGISPNTLKMFLKNNVPQLNGRGYPIRGFAIYAKSIQAKESAVDLGHHICTLSIVTPTTTPL
jgi:hypothetical protein